MPLAFLIRRAYSDIVVTHTGNIGFVATTFQEIATTAEVLIDIKIEPLAEGGYLATSDELQGLIAQGRTVAETIEIAQDVARKLIESCLEHRDPLPPKIRAAFKKRGQKTTLTIPVGVELETTAA